MKSENFRYLHKCKYMYVHVHVLGFRTWKRLKIIHIDIHVYSVVIFFNHLQSPGQAPPVKATVIHVDWLAREITGGSFPNLFLILVNGWSYM